MDELEYELQVDHDELEARLRVALKDQNTISDRDELMLQLKENNVHAGLMEEVIADAFVRLAEVEEPGEVILIAQGKTPKHGKNGDIEFKVDVSGQAVYRGAEANDDNVDFREATTVTSVAPNEFIAEIIPPSDGEDGFNLAGKTLPARKGKPLSIRCGDGVEITSDGRFCKATQQGRPVYSAGTLQVSPMFEVAGDVDFNTGNIKFEGHVVVRGNVQDDFAVEANSIEIMGVVGAAKVTSRGPLQIRGGINGHDKAEITADGDSRCKYINQAKITVLGELIVNREIVNSRIWCRGKVRAEKIIGGDCLALAGIEANILGSDMGVSTVIEPGTNFEVRALEEQITEIAERIETVLRPVEPFFGDRARYKGLPDTKKEEFRQAYESFHALKESFMKLSGERLELLDSTDHTAVKQVIARKLVHPDVFVRTDLCMRQFKKPVTGPVTLIEDIDASTIRPATYIPGKGIVEEEEDEE